MTGTGDAGFTVGGYRCFSRCGRTFDSLEEMTAVPGRGPRSPRHFCNECLPAARKGWGGW